MLQSCQTKKVAKWRCAILSQPKSVLIKFVLADWTETFWVLSPGRRGQICSFQWCRRGSFRYNSCVMSLSWKAKRSGTTTEIGSYDSAVTYFCWEWIVGLSINLRNGWLWKACDTDKWQDVPASWNFSGGLFSTLKSALMPRNIRAYRSSCNLS